MNNIPPRPYNNKSRLSLTFCTSNVNKFQEAQVLLAKYNIPLVHKKISLPEIQDNEITSATVNLSNYPNPFNPTTSINFSIEENTNVEISVYNAKGQKVKTLVSENLALGKHSVTWNGGDDHGKSVSSGIYFYKMRTGKFTAIKKMIMMK